MPGSPLRSRQSAAYARALQVVALVITGVILGRQAAGGFPTVEIGRRLLLVRVTGAAVELTIAALCRPRRPVATLRWFAYLIGIVTAATILAVIAVQPSLLWEEGSALVALFLGASVFMPWSWRWQATFVGVVLAGSIVVIATFESPGDLAPGSAARLFVTLVGIGAASVAGTVLQQRARRQVAASEARYRSLFESAGDGIAVLDEAGAILEANARLVDLLGAPRDRILGRRLGEFYADAPGVGDVSVSREYAAAMGGALRQLSQRLRAVDGRAVDVNITFARIDAPQGPVVQAILRDLTEHRALERHRVQEQRVDAMARLAGGLAHQFNNLLGGILTHASLLREDASTAGVAKELDQILEAARRGRELTNELLRFGEHDVVTLQPTPAVQILDSLAARARTTFPAEVAIEVKAPNDLPPILGDAEYLVHAGVQLLLNARQAMRGETGDRLVLSAAAEVVHAPDKPWAGARPGRYVRFSVSDTGQGMDAATVERVFEPFFTTKPLHEATGLGLATVYRAVKAHGGAIGIESAPGRGTTVHLLIPVALRAAATAPAPAAAPAAIAATARPGGTVLIVDDEEIVRAALKRALTRFGYRVLEAVDGPTAMAALQGADPPVDLVILDMVLPGGGAGVFELLKAVRPDLKVLVSSGYSPDAEAVQGLAARADGFLPKPYEIPELKAAVSKALRGAA